MRWDTINSIRWDDIAFMSKTYVTTALRTEVIATANARCEYCLMPQNNPGNRHEVDHIIAEKHNGETVKNNLCLACFLCNRYKGTDVASYTKTGLLTMLYHPRRHIWSEHFVVSGNRIEPLSDIGEVTVRLFGLNTPEKCERRQGWQEIGRYPLEGDPV